MSDKTYAETQGAPNVDWWNVLAHPEKHDHARLVTLSRSWVTCACGNQCAIIPRFDDEDEQGAPMDRELQNLGVAFYECVEACEWQNAKQVLNEIEKRSTLLIAAERAKLTSTPKAQAHAVA